MADKPKKPATTRKPASPKAGSATAAPEAELVQLRQQLADKDAELQLTLRVNEQLTAELQRLGQYDPQQQQRKAAPVTTSAATFQYDGTTYGFAMVQVRYKGQVITYEQVLASDQLQADLVAMGSGMIKKIS